MCMSACYEMLFCVSCSAAMYYCSLSKQASPSIGLMISMLHAHLASAFCFQALYECAGVRAYAAHTGMQATAAVYVHGCSSPSPAVNAVGVFANL